MFTPAACKSLAKFGITNDGLYVVLMLERYLFIFPSALVNLPTLSGLRCPFIALPILKSLKLTLTSTPFSFIVNMFSGLNLLVSVTISAISLISLAKASLIAKLPSACSSWPLNRSTKDLPTLFRSPLSIDL